MVGKDPTDPGGSGLPEGPKRSAWRPTLMVVLALALLASLIVNAALGVRIRNDRTRSDAQIAELNDQLQLLRARISGTGSDDPLGRIATATANLRGLDFTAAVKPELVSPAELASRIRSMFTSGNSKAEIDANAQVLETLGLLPPGYDFYKELLTLQSEQVAGFYDSKSKRLVVGAASARTPSPFDQVILAHEYTHALTDQHFGLERLDKLEKTRQDEAATAFLALVEGDATFTMRLYASQVLTLDQQQQFATEAAAQPSTVFDAAPVYLQDVLQFPYVQGLAFVTALHDNGGFDLVDQAYRDPPVTTEQILHPARYLDNRDDPTPVALPHLGRALGTGWRSIDHGGVGEYDVLQILEHGGGNGLSLTDAQNAADGWDGGAYAGYRSSDGVLVATLTAWDSESQAREAAAAFARWLPIRYPGGASFGTGTVEGWQTRGGAGEVEQEGSQVMLLLGPSAVDAERARAAFTGF
ncbi:MAG: hypothetical protein ACXVQX_03240 [Actinomycetota bacterium]